MWSGVVIVGLAGMRLAGCGGGGDAPGEPPIRAGDECAPGTEPSCIDGTTCVAVGTEFRCIAEPCRDEDGDGAGIGPGCDVFDCDDDDPMVPSADLSELCNDRDDDCDSAVDEGCPCLEAGAPVPDGSTRPCGMSDCAGTQTCESGSWGTCEGGSEPEPAEICFNGRDDNCDGDVNEGCCPDGEFACMELMVCSSNGMCIL